MNHPYLYVELALTDDVDKGRVGVDLDLRSRANLDAGLRRCANAAYALRYRGAVVTAVGNESFVIATIDRFGAPVEVDEAELTAALAAYVAVTGEPIAWHPEDAGIAG